MLLVARARCQTAGLTLTKPELRPNAPPALDGHFKNTAVARAVLACGGQRPLTGQSGVIRIESLCTHLLRSVTLRCSIIEV